MTILRHVGVHVGAGTWTMGTCKWGPRSWGLVCFSILPHFIYWVRVSWWTQSLPILAILASPPNLGITCLCFQSSGITGSHQASLTFMWVLENSPPHALWQDLYPQIQLPAQFCEVITDVCYTQSVHRDWKVWTNMWHPVTTTTNISKDFLVSRFFPILCLLFGFIFMVKALGMRYTLLVNLQNTLASCSISSSLVSFQNVLNTHTDLHTNTHISCFYTYTVKAPLHAHSVSHTQVHSHPHTQTLWYPHTIAFTLAQAHFPSNIPNFKSPSHVNFQATTLLPLLKPRSLSPVVS